MLDIVKRATTGIGGARARGRPRGVAFLAGPTGVGKTELAKTITELLFGDESAYIRFDMSEFSAEHADQRLIGAPPGYVGYDVGGELTNAVRERPFSVVLFDEIEKAHPRDPRQVPAGARRWRADFRSWRSRVLLRGVHHLHLESRHLLDRCRWHGRQRDAEQTFEECVLESAPRSTAISSWS